MLYIDIHMRFEKRQAERERELHKPFDHDVLQTLHTYQITWPVVWWKSAEIAATLSAYDVISGLQASKARLTKGLIMGLIIFTSHQVRKASRNTTLRRTGDKAWRTCAELHFFKTFWFLIFETISNTTNSCFWFSDTPVCVFVFVCLVCFLWFSRLSTLHVGFVPLGTNYWHTRSSKRVCDRRMSWAKRVFASRWAGFLRKASPRKKLYRIGPVNNQ